jgi:hypothetical protein
MISFNRLGNVGRLANQMFQYASLRGIASNRGFSFCVPPKEFFGEQDINVRNSDTTLYDCFILHDISIAVSSNTIIMENGFSFDENLFNKCPDNVDLFGYFQSEKYFKHIEDEIRKDFTFNNSLVKDVDDFFSSYFEGKDVISLHIRRGDYTNNPNHPVQTLEYYSKALSKLDSNIPVIIFSDDPSWCNNQELFSDDRFSISEKNSTEFDLCLMSKCKYHIIGNSSFSWWGSWLAKSEKTIAPSNWFGGDCANHDTKDLYLEDWEII